MPPQKEPLSCTSSSSRTCSTESTTGDEASTCTSAAKSRVISPPATLCTLVMIDMLSVSLVVPLLHQYYKSAGVHSASQREMLSSLFSSSQIIGGVLIGALSDMGVLSRRRVLFLSFLGSALSYALIIGGNIYQLICSRVIVGLVKQTMTVSTSLMAQYTDGGNRTVWMGRLGASTTSAWIVGPSVGALLYKHAGQFAPAAVACGLFLVNSVIAAALLPSEDEMNSLLGNNSKHGNETDVKSRKKLSLTSFFRNLKQCFTSGSLASIVISLLLYGWVARSTSYANMSSFYEEKYGIMPHQRGYIKSYQMCLNIFVQSFLVRTLLTRLGGETNAACIGAFALSAATFCEMHATFTIFVGLVCPVVAVSVEMVSVSLRSLLTQIAPKASLSSVLAALDVLQNAASISVPLYRAILFRLLSKVGYADESASMIGDPDPNLWLLSSTLHWFGFASVVTLLLISNKATQKSVNADKKSQ